jgi:uncharacterized protein with beta-barrel porin domain
MGFFSPAARLASLSTVALASAAAPLTLSVTPALAACSTSGVAPADITFTCAANTTTTNTTNSTSPNATTSDRIQSFAANITGQVNTGVTVSGFGLELDTTKAAGAVSLTNNGTISSGPNGGAVVTLTGNGGNISYSGSGSITGAGGNVFGLELLNTVAGTGAATATITGGSITATGNSVFGLGVFSSTTGGINVNTSGGHSIILDSTASGSTNRGMFIQGSGATGDIVIVSGSHIFATGGAASLGTIIGIDASQQGTGNISVTSNGVIDMSGTTQTGSSGMFLTHSGTSGNITTDINANIIAGTGGGVGVFATFSNAASHGTALITIESAVTVSGGTGVIVDGGTGTHAVTVITGTGSHLTTTNESIHLLGATTNLGLTNSGSITSTAGTAVSVGGNISGTNTGSISGVTGIVASTAGSNFINAGVVTGTGGTAIQFTGAGNTLTLQNGTNITGTVNGGTAATFQLGGTTGTPSFDASKLGSQYTNFSTFNKIESGTWTLTGNNAAVLPWTVSAGTLNVNGTTGFLMTVNGGTLAGTGNVGNTQVNAGGTFAPGSGVPGSSMTVNGSLAFQSGAQYVVFLNPTTSSFVNATGTATLGNATVNAMFANGSYVAKQYTIVSAGGISGTFNSTITNTNLPSNFHTSLSYDGTHAFLDLALNFSQPGGGGPSSTSGLNNNQQNVANALTNFFNTNGSIPMIFGALTPAGLTQLSGESATASQQTTFDAMNQFMGLLTDPFVSGRGDPISAGGTPTPYANETLAYAAKNKTNAFAMFTKAPPYTPFAQRWSVWAAGYGGSQTTSGDARVLGSNDTRSSIFGAAVGVDYRLSPNTIAGFALAGGGTNFSVNTLGYGRSDLFQAGGFIRHNVGAAYVTGALAYGWQDITTDRIVTIAGFDHLRAQFNANAWSGRIEGGYRWAMGGFGLTPYAAAQAVTFDLPTYVERAIVGSNQFALGYGAKNVTDVRSELGVRTDKSFAAQNGIFTLRGRLAWAHDYDPDRNVLSTFQTLPGASFVVNGARHAADSALTTASAEWRWVNGWSAAATFEGEFSNVTNSYAGKGVVRYTW